jgi:diketogulonate reductase-like aldo/keto reductase
MSAIPSIEFSDGKKLPQVGLGLWQVKDAQAFRTVFEAAWAAGYRHFDTAQIYHNEYMLGEAWKTMGLNREELWITSKVSVTNFGAKRATNSIDDSLKKLQTDYIDLMLLHFPVPVLRKASWLALEQAKAAGKVRSIGVSNYTLKHLEEMRLYATEMPAVNQVELHVFLQQPELVEYCRQHGIVVEAYSPLAHGKRMHDETVQAIAEQHNKSYAQILLRWGIESGLVVLPKSTTPERIRENIDLFGFGLDTDDMQKLAQLDSRFRTCWNPTHIP